MGHVCFFYSKSQDRIYLIVQTTAKDQYGNFEIIKPQGFIESPAVSVVMSVYNGCDFLEESIKSIHEQSFQQFEFIIVNDGSKDNSLEFILQHLLHRRGGDI